MLTGITAGDFHVDKPFKTSPRQQGVPVRTLDVLENLDYIIDFGIENEVDVFLITGDVYDKSNPTNRTRTMVHNRLTRAADHMTVIIIVGNHDLSVSRWTDHALADLRNLRPENIIVLDKPETVSFGSYDIFCLPWLVDVGTYNVEVNPTVPTIAISHCSVPEAIMESGINIGGAEIVIGKNFVVPLGFFEQFDMAVLGHIHKAQNWNNTIYPGSIEHLTWGEYNDGSVHGFVHFELGNDTTWWEHIAIPTRKRIEIVGTLEDLVLPEEIDPEVMYRLVVSSDTPGATFPVNYYTNWFNDGFSFTLKKYAPRRTFEREGIEIEDEMTPGELIKMQIEAWGEEWDDELKTEWENIYEDN